MATTPPASYSTIYKSLGNFLTHSDNEPVIGSTSTSWVLQPDGNGQEGPFTISLRDMPANVSLTITLDDTESSKDGSRGISLKPLEQPAPNTQRWKLKDVANFLPRSDIPSITSSMRSKGTRLHCSFSETQPHPRSSLSTPYI